MSRENTPVNVSYLYDKPGATPWNAKTPALNILRGKCYLHIKVDGILIKMVDSVSIPNFSSTEDL